MYNDPLAFYSFAVRVNLGRPPSPAPLIIQPLRTPLFLLFVSESSATSFPKFGAMPEWIRLLRDATATEHIKPIWARPHGKEKGARYQPSTIPKNEAKMWLAAALYSKDTAHSFIWDALEKNPVLKVVCQQCDTLLRLTTVDESNEI